MLISAVAPSGSSAQTAPAPVAPAAPPPAAPAPDEAAVRRAIAAVNRALQPVTNSLEFSVDGGSGKTIVRVVDTETQQVIRQIPSEEMVEISRVLERLEGLLFKQRA